MARNGKKGSRIPRREFLRASAVSAAAMGTIPSDMSSGKTAATITSSGSAAQVFNSRYSGERLSRIAFPMGGMGAGMICLEGRPLQAGLSVRKRARRPQICAGPITVVI